MVFGWRHALLAVVAVGLCGCHSGRKSARLDSEVAAVVDWLARTEPRCADPPVPEASRAPQGREASRDPPEGYLLVTPTARSHPRYGNAVLLTEPHSQRLVPILIGGTEGLSIELRLSKRKYTRPLTHDLMDQAIAKLGARLLRAQVDALKDGVYLGTIVLTRGDETFALDSRPSDAVALAIGNDVPIFISKKLLDVAGIEASELDQARARPQAEPVAL